MIDVVAQVLGYLASVLLALSLLVNNDLKFRWLNTFGNISFISYGIIINAFPLILTNSILLLINLYRLVKIYKTEEDFDLLEFNEGGKLIDKFLSFHEEDIKQYFPAYNLYEENNNLKFIVLRDMAVANIFVASVSEDGTATVRINYTVAKYRDYKVGKFIFDKEKSYLLSKGVKVLLYEEVYNKHHKKFLLKMGFKKEVFNGKQGFIKRLD
ncbi:MAG TPA: hypothetical protein VF622_17765 [Segetibacter sp.]|jgi:hypothetical protein